MDIGKRLKAYLDGKTPNGLMGIRIVLANPLQYPRLPKGLVNSEVRASHGAEIANVLAETVKRNSVLLAAITQAQKDWGKGATLHLVTPCCILAEIPAAVARAIIRVDIHGIKEIELLETWRSGPAPATPESAPQA